MATNDPERTTPNGTAPGRAKNAIRVVRTATPALAWRYPTRTPARVMITNPPAPGKAPAASAHSETGRRAGCRQTCRKDDPAPIGCGIAGGAVPSRTPLTLDLAQSHRAVQPRLPRRSPAGPRHRRVAGPRYRQVAGPAAIATPLTHPRLPTAQGRGCLPIRPLPAAPRRCPTRRNKDRRAVARAGRPPRQPRSACPEPMR